MKFDDSLTRADSPSQMLELLSVASSLAFKIWKLSRPLRIGSMVLAVALVGLLGWYCWENWNNPIVAIDFGKPDEDPWQLKWSGAALAALAAVLVSRIPAFLRNVVRLVDFRKTAYEIAVGAGMGILGWIAAGLHLLVFDRWYLKWGSQERLINSKNKPSSSEL